MSIHNPRGKQQEIGVNTRDGIDSYECQTRVVKDNRILTKEMMTTANGK